MISGFSQHPTNKEKCFRKGALVRENHRAFTLVELLVTIGIIIVLVGLLVPAFSRMRDTAMQTQCNSNLRQVYQVLQSYVQDNNGRYPLLYNSVENNVKYLNVWQYYLCTYVGKAQTWGNGQSLRTDPRSIFNCPVRTKDPTALKTSYAFNSFIWDLPWDRYAMRVPNPAGIILLGEIDSNNDNMTSSDGKMCISPGNVGSATWGKPSFRHARNTSANYLFCDGHVELLTPDSLVLQPSSGASLWRWW